MDSKPRLHGECGSIVTNQEKSPDQQLLEEKGEILSCGGVYLSASPAPVFKKEDTYQFLFLPNYRQGVIMYKNLEAMSSTEQELHLGETSLREVGTSHEALRRLFREGLN
ncbi:MAG: hypothetical protein U1F66_12880 [bacterium]